MEQTPYFPGMSLLASRNMADEKIDAMETVGNAGLNWNSLEKYVSLPSFPATLY